MLASRYRRIIFFFARVLASFAFWDLILPRLGLGALARRTRSERFRRSAASFRQLAVRMGGVLIKVGQFLSARADILPTEITVELAGLQDEVPPEDFQDIRRLAESELGGSLEELFIRVDETPLAAASLGQVHRAWLPCPDEQDCTEDVIIKVQRPNIEVIIATDLRALKTVGRWINHHGPIRRRANIPQLLEEFTEILHGEIDYIAEGHNADTFSKNFEGSPCIRIPQVFWTHTTKRVLTLEDVWAIKITDYDRITSAGVSREEVASRLLDTYLQQIFEDGFFHADPHPGNLFVNPLEPGEERACEWELTFVDFGMVGRVEPHILEGLRELMIAVGTRDAHRVVEAYQRMGVLLPGADLSLIEQAEARAFERFWGKSMRELQEISFQEARAFAAEFRELLFQLPFQIPHGLILLGRCVGILAGMCTGLDPNFNVWEHLVPYAQKLIAQESGNLRTPVLEELERLARTLFGVPGKLDRALDKLERGEIAVQNPQLSEEMQSLTRAVYKLGGSIIFAALLLSGVQLYISGESALAAWAGGGAFLTLLWLFFSLGRNPQQ